MKQKYTKAKAANRPSGFQKSGMVDTSSKKRIAKRLHLQRKVYSYGCQILRVQRIFYRKDQFGNKCYKFVRHPQVENAPVLS